MNGRCHLWLSLSKDYFRLPTHVCVVFVLVVAIRILYNINSNGEWEKSLSHNDNAEDSTERQKHKCTWLLQHLYRMYKEIADPMVKFCNYIIILLNLYFVSLYFHVICQLARHGVLITLLCTP